VLIEAKTRKSDVSFQATPQEKLLFAALRAGIALPYECATGTCGTCKARRLSGVLIEDWTEAPGRSFLKAERDEVLMCQTRALSDCSFEIPGAADLAGAPQPRPAFGSAVIEDIERLTADVAALRLRLDPSLEFVAGQFMVLRTPALPGFRAYSMVNFECPCDSVELVIKHKPGGGFTNWLFGGAAPGDTVEWFGPLGKATFDPREQRTIVAIAGGSGIASIVSILEAGFAVRHFETFEADVFFGVRTGDDVFYLDRLEGFVRQFPERLRVTIVLSHAAPSDALRRRHPMLAFESGFPHEIAARNLAGRFAGRVAYLAGPPILVDVSIRMLVTQARLPVRDIRYDKFS
jgi:toluene monooxygenase electron transfer component